MMTRKSDKRNKTGKTTSSKAAKKAAGSFQEKSAAKPGKSVKPAAVKKGVTAKKTAPVKVKKVAAGGKQRNTEAQEKPGKKHAAVKTGITARKIISSKGTGKTIEKKTATAVPAIGMGEERETFPALPREYGENDLLLMVVDPDVIYAAWEISRDALPEEKGEITMRISEVNGIGISGARADRPFLDIKVEDRVGSGFFDIHMPGISVVAEIGLLFADSTFKPILRSPVVSFPKLLAFDELGIVRKLFEPGMRVGY
jgi:hypothetical protein